MEEKTQATTGSILWDRALKEHNLSDDVLQVIRNLRESDKKVYKCEIYKFIEEENRSTIKRLMERISLLK